MSGWTTPRSHLRRGRSGLGDRVFWRVLTAEEHRRYPLSPTAISSAACCSSASASAVRPDLPLSAYLAEVRGYSAIMIGETMFVSGITSS